jgi:hypothetical protein
VIRIDGSFARAAGKSCVPVHNHYKIRHPPRMRRHAPKGLLRHRQAIEIRAT